MRIQVTANDLNKAIARAFLRRCFVQRVATNSYIAHCLDGHDHLVEIEEDCHGHPVTAVCIECPSAFGHRACYHIASVLAVHLGLKSMQRAAAISASRVVSITAHVRASQSSVPRLSRPQSAEDSVLLSGVREGRGERVRGFMI